MSDQDVKIIRSCCYSPPGCHPVGCGVRLHVKDGELIKIEGDPEHYITKGALCARALAIKEYMYHPDRILYPIKRAKEDRGKDKWERITWDEAIEMIYEEHQRITAKYGPETMLVFGGTGRAGHNYYSPMAYAVFGTPNSCYAQSGWSCYGPRMSFTMHSLGFGFPEIDSAAKFADRYDHPGWEAPKYVVLWGKEPLKSNPDGFFGHSLIEMSRWLGTKIIMVDPRMTWLGTKADEVLHLRPGTDAALGMALLNVIINEDLYDHEFVEKWCYGFDELAERVQEMPPSKAAEICWLEEEQIVRVARKIAAAKPVSFGWGLAVDQNPNGAQTAQCIIAMIAITGNFDIPGGTMLGALHMSDALMPDALAMEIGVMTQETYMKRIGNDTHPAVNSVLPTAAPDAVLDCLESDEPYPLRMAFFSSSNVIGAAISSAPQRWYEALKKMEFCFATETFHNPTTMGLCDLVLPLSCWTEHDAFVQTNYDLNTSFWGCSNKAVTVGEGKSDADITVLLGKRFAPQFWGQFETGRDYIVKSWVPHGMSWEEFSEAVAVPSEEPYRKYELGLLRPDGQPGFMTSTGKIELYNNTFASFGDDPLPYFQEPPYSPYSTPDLAEEFPLVLTTGARTWASFHSENRQQPSLRELCPEPLFELHPDKAAELDLKEGDWCWIETPFGKAKQKLTVTPIIDPRVAHAMHGWWFPEREPEAPYLYGNWESNINVAMPHGVNGKLGFGDCFKTMICKVYKVEE